MNQKSLLITLMLMCNTVMHSDDMLLSHEHSLANAHKIHQPYKDGFVDHNNHEDINPIDEVVSMSPDEQPVATTNLVTDVGLHNTDSDAISIDMTNVKSTKTCDSKLVSMSSDEQPVATTNLVTDVGLRNTGSDAIAITMTEEDSIRLAFILSVVCKFYALKMHEYMSACSVLYALLFIGCVFVISTSILMLNIVNHNYIWSNPDAKPTINSAIKN